MILTVKGLHVESYLNKIYVEYDEWLDFESKVGKDLHKDLIKLGVIDWRATGYHNGNVFLTFDNPYVSQNLHRVADLLAEHFPLSTIRLSETH